MTKKIAAILAMLLLGAAQNETPSPFDGSWRTDLSSLEFSKRPQVIELKQGVYTCRSCTPVYSIKADGAFHPVSDDPSVDERRVDILGANAIRQFDRKDGRIIHDAEITVSTDGGTRTVAWSDHAGPDAPRMAGKTIQSRQGPPAAGAHAVSGSWVTVAVTEVTDAAMTETLKLEGGFLSMSRATGESYRAQVDGPPATYVGNPAITEVTVTRAGPRELIETSIYRGQPLTALHMIVSADGKTLQFRAVNKKTGAVSAARANKVD